MPMLRRPLPQSPACWHGAMSLSQISRPGHQRCAVHFLASCIFYFYGELANACGFKHDQCMCTAVFVFKYVHIG